MKITLDCSKQSPLLCSMKDKPEDKILKAIKINPESTVREIAKAAGLSGSSHADYHLKALMLKGKIRKVNKWEILTD